MKIFAFQRQEAPFNIETGGTKGGILHRQFPEKTDEEILSIAIQERRDKGKIPLDAVVHIIDDSVLPTGVSDSKYFNDWEWDDATERPVVNMSKARIRHMAAITKALDAELLVQDKAVNKAGDDGDAGLDTAERAKRKALRDIPQTFDLSNAPNVTALEALWPPDIPRPSS